MKKEKASRNGNGNSRIAEQLGIIRCKNSKRKEAYLNSHVLIPEVLPELFKSYNLRFAAQYITRFSVVPLEVASAAHKAGRSSLLKGFQVAAA